MSISAPRSEQAAARFAEAQSLADKGFRERGVESLHAAAELAVDELAEREGVEIAAESLGWHEARARACVRLRQLGAVPAGFDNLLRRLNDDRKRTKYDDKPTRFDPMTFAQAQASVRLVIESLGVSLPGEPVEAPAPPPEATGPPAEVPEPPAAAPARQPHRTGLVVGAVAIAVAAAVAIVALIAFRAGEDQSPARKPKPAGTRVVTYGSTARVGRLEMSVDTARTGPRVGRPALPARRGTYVLVNLRVENPTDRTLPLRFDAFRLHGGAGGIYRPSVQLTQFTLPIDPGQRQSLPLPFDVPPREVRGAQLLADVTSASGASRRPGATFDLDLGDGLGELMPGTWKGKTSEGRPFTMKIDKGDVVRTIRFSTKRGSCTIPFRGAAFVEGGRFRAGSEAIVNGAFSSSVAASGTATSAPAGRCQFGTIGWRASTTLR
ncbi:MAG TPA: hypothetical protein VGJ32_07965 [Solirubrobacteraceae bacterium]|jgi:hypothetical protein